ncbi:MAG: alpha-L-rhamnosidase [Balneolaceae bacterium]|nr:MAG: alpha-L-rhamnosidase [Balneolaceae bacterium]
MTYSRREFVKNSMFGSAGLIASPFSNAGSKQAKSKQLSLDKAPDLSQLYSPLLDLSPARWIWYPSQRTLQNSVFLFRKTVCLDSEPASATGWILADSRYKLYVNGEYIQFGPAPFDPRQPEADPVDITKYLKSGENVIGAEVLYYGVGEGTWPTGKPGFILNISLYKSGRETRVVTDETWQVSLAESWKPGQYKRWYLRAFQEEFDARKYPYGWNRSDFESDHRWLQAMEIDLPADKPPISSPYDEYQQEIMANPDDCNIRKRSIPLMKEFEVNKVKLADQFGVEWIGDTDRYFEFVTPGLYEPASLDSFRDLGNGRYSVSIDPPKAAVLTFEFEEQIVGFPYFTIEAPEGTVVEMMIQEGHEPGNFLMNNRLHSWTRFICREGKNEFITFDYESLRWIQFHIHGQRGVVTVSNVGVRRRMSGWDTLPFVETSDDEVNRVLSATVNTLYNSSQDLMVDCMGRERQQYSGDVGHQVHPLFSAFGDHHLPLRFVNTFSQGITLDGFFMDSWPAYDRLARIPQRQMGLTMWGPIIDHGVGFVFDCFYSFLYSGKINSLHEVYPRLLRFYEYLNSLKQEDGLLPVENLGLTWVWMDTDCYTQQRHKQCSFNLYTAAMMQHALAPIARAIGDEQNAEIIAEAGQSILKKTIDRFWDERSQLFVDNLPWMAEEGGMRLSDRTLSMAVIHDLCPGDATEAAVELLENPPDNLGLSFPANAIWRLWALGQAGKADAIIDEIKNRWHRMDSVQLNNTLQEHWNIQPDTRGQWSHCAVGPLFAVYQGLAGIEPLEPGMKKVQIKPKPGELEELNLHYHTPNGKIQFSCSGKKGNRGIHIELPESCDAVLIVDKREVLNYVKILEYSSKEHDAYRLGSGMSHKLDLRYT